MITLTALLIAALAIVCPGRRPPTDTGTAVISPGAGAAMAVLAALESTTATHAP